MEPPEQSVAEEDGLPPALGDKDLADAILHRRFCPSLITTETWEGFEFAGLRIRITESTDCYGAVLWPSALVLCHFLDTHREEYSMEDKSIIELGAGTGLVSIVTALLVYISLYYVAFYVVMTSLFALAIYVLMSTLNPYTPDYQDRLTSPGVMVWPDTYGEEDVEISFNSSDRKSWSRMSNCLKDFLQPYNKSQQLQVNIQDCKWGTYFFQKDFEGPDHTKQSCVFYRSMLGNCSGMSDPTFGYSDGTPCVIIKMNRIINFLPDNRSGKTPYVNCTLLEGSDSVSHIEYFPANGTMDLAYFPYYGKKAQVKLVRTPTCTREREQDPPPQVTNVSMCPTANIHEPTGGGQVPPEGSPGGQGAVPRRGQQHRLRELPRPLRRQGHLLPEGERVKDEGRNCGFNGVMRGKGRHPAQHTDILFTTWRPINETLQQTAAPVCPFCPSWTLTVCTTVLLWGGYVSISKQDQVPSGLWHSGLHAHVALVI
uniref:Potassium-transporting ATPase subunit beta n=1 Tax=Scleropages formosus TaxID=113540 RepID=A0A8C9VCP7_SCLFO